MIREKYSGETIDDLVKFFNLKINGILHVGAHKCEELNVYTKYVDIKNIYWIEANPNLVNQFKNSIPNIINEIVSDSDGQSIKFKITNNTLSSSILDLEYHKTVHPNVVVSDIIEGKSKTLKTTIIENCIPQTVNLLVLDLQGVELMALKGLKEFINNFDYIYTEVNELHLYKNGCLIEELDSYLKNFNFNRKYTSTLNGYGNGFYIKNK
jgi:FkbM family methyltransferase